MSRGVRVGRSGVEDQIFGWVETEVRGGWGKRSSAVQQTGRSVGCRLQVAGRLLLLFLGAMTERASEGVPQSRLFSCFFV